MIPSSMVTKEFYSFNIDTNDSFFEEPDKRDAAIVTIMYGNKIYTDKLG